MRALALILLLVFSLSAPAVRADDCAPFRLDDPGGVLAGRPPSNQGLNGNCYAHAAANLISSWLRKHGAREYDVSPASIALAYSLDNFEKECDLGGTDYEYIDSGWLHPTLESYAKHGACLVADDPLTPVAGQPLERIAQTLANTSNSRLALSTIVQHWDENTPLAEETLALTISRLTGAPPKPLTPQQRMERGLGLVDPGVAFEATVLQTLTGVPALYTIRKRVGEQTMRASSDQVYACLGEAGANLPHPAVVSAAFKNGGRGERFLWDALESSCVKPPFPAGVPPFRVNSIERFTAPRPNWNQEFSGIIRHGLSQGLPVSIGITGAFLRKGSVAVGNDNNHAVTVVGKRPSPSGSGCDLLVRNSWGTECSYYASEFPCENGQVWIKEDLLSRNSQYMSELVPVEPH